MADRRKKRADKKNAANASAAEEEADAEDVNEETATQETEERQQTSQVTFYSIQQMARLSILAQLHEHLLIYNAFETMDNNLNRFRRFS